MNIKRLGVFTITAVLSATLFSCSSSPTSIEIYKGDEKVSSISLGANTTTQLAAKVLPSSASQEIRWESNDTDIALVNTTGLVSGIKEGSTTITCYAYPSTNIKKTINVQVTGDFALSDYSLNMVTGDIRIIKATPNDNVTWSVDNSNIATVDDGIVTAKAKGNTVVHATRRGTTLDCAIQVEDASGKTGKITLDKTSTSLSINESKKITATCDKSNVVFRSSDSSIVSVDSTGNINGKKSGSVTIYAYNSDDIKECVVTVTASIAKTVGLNQTWYVAGYGNYQSGANYSNEGGYKFIKDDKARNDYLETYRISEKQFSIGDCLKFYNADQSVELTGTAATGGGSFLTNNASKDDMYYDELRIDILMTGKYTIDLSIDKNYHPIIEVYNSSSTISNLDKNYAKEATIDVFSYSDWHGNVSDIDKNRPGIEKFSTYIKEQINKCSGEPLLLNNGDMWQGSYFSNSNNGELLNDVNKYLNTDAFNLGNHEFDFTQDIIKNNQKLANSGSDHRVPFLGANVIYYSGNKRGKIVDYVQPYTIVEKNGIRIGIIGVIGTAQITSVLSTNVQDICFSNDITAIKDYSDKLRSKFGCEIVLAMDHYGVSSVSNAKTFLFNNGLTEISSSSNQRYIDGFVFGHDHSFYDGVYNDVGFVDASSNGRNLSHMVIEYKEGKSAVTTNTENIGFGEISSYQPDPNVTKIMRNHITDEQLKKAALFAGKFDSDKFDSYTYGPRVLAKAMYEYAQNKGYNVCLSLINNARNSLPEGEATYYDLYTSFPFSNKTVIVRVKGSELKNESQFDSTTYYGENDFVINPNQYYLIAVYDYIIYHQNTSKNYNYFPSLDISTDVDAELSDKLPADILFDYMNGGTVYYSDYSGTNEHHFSFIS